MRSRRSTVSEFHAEAPQTTASEGLAQGPYVAATAGFKHTTLRMKGDESTKEPHIVPFIAVFFGIISGPALPVSDTASTL